MMKAIYTSRPLAVGVLGVVLCCWASQVQALGDGSARAMAMGQAYTALARDGESPFWNPANLSLGAAPRFTWDAFGLGGLFMIENNSFSVATYNKHFTDSQHFITLEDKRQLLRDIPASGLQVNADMAPYGALLVPVNGGVTFDLPEGMRGAVTLGLTAGAEGATPKDMAELALFGNQFDRQYDIADWDGQLWAVGSLNLAVARPWMPAAARPHFDAFFVGATAKITGGVLGETFNSDGGFLSRVDGADLELHALSQIGGGWGMGVDLGVAGKLKDGQTTVSAGLINFFDFMVWGIRARQDSLFMVARDLRVTRAFKDEVQSIEDVLENEDIDGDGDKDFHKQIGSATFYRSMPAQLRLGATRRLSPKLLVAGNWDQAFSNGFGIRTTPRLSAGAEYHLVDWLATRFGLSLGGRVRGASIGFGVGPFDFNRVRLQVLDVALVSRGGFVPGLAKGTAIAVELFHLSMR